MHRFIDYRGRERFYDNNGKSIPYKPTKKIEKCFDVQTISWVIEVTNKFTGKKLDIVTASAAREREFRKTQAELYTFN